MRSRVPLLIAVTSLLVGLLLIRTAVVYSADRLEERLRKYFENEPALLKVHVPADKKGINYYPFRKDKKLDYVGRSVNIYKGATATIYRVKVQADYIEIQFNEGGGQTVGRIFTKSDWPFDGKNYGGRINVRFERDINDEDLAIPRMVAMLSPLFCLIKDYDKNCYVEPLPERPMVEAEEAPRAFPPTVQITANPDTIRRGECSNLSWKTAHADNLEITDLGTVELRGRQEVCPQRDTCYQADASGPGGKASDEACVSIKGPAIDDDFNNNIRDVFFALDRSELRAAARNTLDANIAWLRRNPDVRFILEGHCDERATAEYNIGLGMRRAQAVREYLINNGITADRFTLVTYGEERPFASCRNESCWSQNRRVHFVQQ